MLCLTDNDFLLKLAACDLLPETIALLGITQGDVLVLPTAKYKIRKDKRLPAKYGDGVNRALDFLEHATETNLKPDPQEQRLLDAVRDPESGERLIHEGEQVLFASSARLPDFLLATGDKVCLRALTNAPACAAIHARHCGRVLCVEQAFLWLIESEGFEIIRAKAVPALACDISLRAAFGSGMAATRANVESALRGYVETLHTETGGLLKRTLAPI